jgi:uncharacterized repeat protein (TIGR01451 family)
MNVKHALACLMALPTIALNPNSAQATTFPSYPLVAGTTTSATQWRVDRYAPAAFVNDGAQLGRVDVLRVSVASIDGQLTRPPGFNTPFYNIQGRDIGFPSVAGAGTTVAASLFIPAAWNTSNVGDTLLNRRSDFFVQLTPLVGDDTPCSAGECLYFAGMDFSNAQIVDPLVGGGPPRIRILKKGIGDGWINQTEPYRSDAWNDMCITFTGNTLEYRLNGNLLFTDTSLVPLSTADGPVNRIRTVGIANYNFSSSFDARWADIEYGQRASLAIARTAPSVAPIGGTISFQTTVTNTGSTTATGVQVVEPAVAGLALQSVSGACTSLPCNIGTLNAGAQAVYTSVYNVTSIVAGPLSSRAIIRTNNVDCDKADNGASNNVLVGAPAAPLRQAPTLSIWGGLAMIVSLFAFALYGSREHLR